MRRLIKFYRLQFEVMRTWRPRRRSRIRRIIVSLVVSAISLVGAVLLTPGLDLAPGGHWVTTALAGAVCLGLLNLFVRPIFIAAFAAVSVVAVAIATVLFQIVAFLIVPNFLTDLHISGPVSALVASLMYALVNTSLTSLLSITDDDSYWAVLMQQVAARSDGVIHSESPGLVVVQIDGLARPILQRQVQAGRVPFLSHWLRSGQYRLDGWEALLPPTTPASQAGILHGNNDGIPAFRWYEKEAGRLMVANRPDDALIVAGRISNGEGLLSNDGASVGNLFSGDAARSYISMATIRDREQGLGRSQTFVTFFASPYNWLGTIVRSIAEMLKEYVQASRSQRAGCRTRWRERRPTWRSATSRPRWSSRRCTAARRSSTWTTPTTTRSPTTAAPSGPRPSTRSTAWTVRSPRSTGRPRTRRAHTASSWCLTTARRSAPHSSSGTAGRSATSCAV